MLRRNVSLAEVVANQDEPEPAPQSATEPAEPPPAATPAPESLPRVPPSLGRAHQLDTTTLRIDPRPQSRSSGMERLRAEALQSVIARVEDRHFGGLRDRFRWKRNRIGARLVLGVVAIAAGGLAAYLSTQSNTPPPVSPPEPAAVVAAPVMVPVLVASDTIAAGHRVTAAALGWEEWPAETVRPDFITQDTTPDAPVELSGRLARTDILPGEPIREQKLAEGGQSLLASMLSPGMRAVSAAVSAETASGGFVVPNDRVDVVLTRQTAPSQTSDTILRNVRVLAVNAQLGSVAPGSGTDEVGPQASAPVFGSQAIATLEVDAAQAEVLISAMTMGRLSLILRSGNEVATGGADSAANQAIRLTSPFWTN